jgi:hypothetical protein
MKSGFDIGFMLFVSIRLVLKYYITKKGATASVQRASAGRMQFNAPRSKVNARSESKRKKVNSERLGSRYRSAASRCLNGISRL